MSTPITAEAKPRIRKGDTVTVISGRAKGRQGKVLSVNRFSRRIIVEKVNLIKRHVRPSRESKGGIIEKEGPIHISNVMLVCPECGKPTRVAIRVLESGQRLRVCKRCHEAVEKAKTA
ncbi:MAG TPA: 50S ribosomal protein L24 [Nitrospiria bacterium]|nr:50S ribosomal protein L24 [Nitrospiria bacterium]